MIEGQELLQALEQLQAFDAVPLARYRTTNYVDFERLADVPCETWLQGAIENVRRCAVIGPLGSGKSTLIEHVVTGLPKTATLWVSAAHEEDAHLLDPVEFARHMIRQIVRWAADAGSLSVEERQAALVQSARAHPRSTTQRSQTIGVKLAAGWIEPAWSQEIQQTLADPEVERLGTEIVASLDRLVDLIHDRGLRPLVVVDDSDRWLNTQGVARAELLNGFFGKTCRMLAERNWAIALAVHPEYCDSDGYRSAQRDGWINDRLDVPSLRGPDAIRLLFDERVSVAAEDAAELQAIEAGELKPEGPWPKAAHVFENGFEALLFELYEQTGLNVRTVLTVADQTLREAIRRGEDRIPTDALRTTILTLGFGRA